ncbi:phosphodiester glycosidase family protein [Micromonospora sp. NPDC049559]|uniref:phosphodiester glycosidase family protein n=1 Tax=Micromonospora sp. NPDC049559 TaxID=3155923 RepID=UPI00342F4F8F
MRRPRAHVLAGAALVLVAAVTAPAGVGHARPPTAGAQLRLALDPGTTGTATTTGIATTAAAPLATTAIAPGLTLSDVSLSGPVKGKLLTADLAESTLKPKYLNPGTVAATTALTTQAGRAGVVAAVNGDFFDIGATGAPRGIGIDGGNLLNGPAAGWNDVAAFYADGRAGLAQIFLDGVITLPGGRTLTATNLNSPNIAHDGIGIYNPLWGSQARSQALDGAARAREVEVSQGKVIRVSTSAGGKVAEGSVALLGVDAGADALSGLAVGDAVSVDYRPRGGDGAQVAIGGNLVLLRDGVVTTQSHPLNPRTAIAFSADGLKVWLLAIDGRTSASVGMTYVQLGNYLKSIGADDALNLDGGGSTTMVARLPGSTSLSVVNTPSDGAQRPVPNGIGFVSTSPCLATSYDLGAYPQLAAGATGVAVTIAQCLLGGGAASGTLDPATVAAVRQFQTDRGLPVTGVVDAHTWTALLSAGDRPTLQSGSTGEAVRRLQRALTAALGRTVGIDGQFGTQTKTAVTDYQRSRGLDPDGLVGPLTWAALQAGR